MNETRYPPPLHHHLEAASHPPEILPETSREKRGTVMPENVRHQKAKYKYLIFVFNKEQFHFLKRQIAMLSKKDTVLYI